MRLFSKNTPEALAQQQLLDARMKALEAKHLRDYYAALADGFDRIVERLQDNDTKGIQK